MASKFQHRLVGTIVLVAVGVIVLPDILDGKKSHYQEESASIPIQPEQGSRAEEFEILEPQEDTAMLPDSPVSATQDEERVSEEETEPKIAASNRTPTSSLPSSTPKTVENETVKVAVKEVPEKNAYTDSAWVIQLMALKNAENAEVLVKDLQKRGYQAHTRRENEFTRIIIGPDASKSKLERQVLELEKITGSKGQLLKFKPLNP